RREDQAAAVARRTGRIARIFREFPGASGARLRDLLLLAARLLPLRSADGHHAPDRRTEGRRGRGGPEGAGARAILPARPFVGFAARNFLRGKVPAAPERIDPVERVHLRARTKSGVPAPADRRRRGFSAGRSAVRRLDPVWLDESP